MNRFEELYREAAAAGSDLPWFDREPNPNLVSWWAERGPVEGWALSLPLGKAARALVVGCGLGDDAEWLAAQGCAVTAFDVAPSAVDAARARFPESPVDYVAADALAPPPQWTGAFDFVFEAYTLQVLPPEMRGPAAQGMAACVASGGTLLLVARGRDEGDDEGTGPWPLLRSEVTEPFETAGLTVATFEDYLDAEDPPVRRFRVTLTR